MDEPYRSMAKVIQKIDDYKFVINRGSANDVKLGSTYLIFRLGEMLIDPDTLEQLGILEIVIGRARVVHIQERLATLESAETTTVPGTIKKVKRTGTGALALTFGPSVEEIEEGPKTFTSEIEVEPGDLARPI
jgi:hypothetical protein